MIELCLYVAIGYAIVKLVQYIKSKVGTKPNEKNTDQD